MACACDICAGTLEPDARQRLLSERLAWAHASSSTVGEADAKQRWLAEHVTQPAPAQELPPEPPKKVIGRPFVKGQSGNPKGSPIRVIKVRHLLKGHEETWAQSLIADLTHTNGKVRAMARVTYAAYRWGLPAKEVVVSGQKGRELQLTVTHDGDPDRIAAILQVLSRAGVFPAGLPAGSAGQVIDAEVDEVHPAPSDAAAVGVPPTELS
jgi:hypothetical protein